MHPSEPRKIRVVCANQDVSQHMAWGEGDSRGWGYSIAEAVMDLLIKDNEIVVEEVPRGK